MISGFRKVPCVIQRGGTSKGIFLQEKDLPQDPELRTKVILAIFGSPDRRQIDGLGGADPLTSKVAIVAPSNRPDADVDYTFGAVDLNEAIVDFSGNCGNISSGVGPFAIDEELVQAQDGETVVRIFNTNTKKIFNACVSTPNKKTQYLGNYAIDGVPGTGSKILLDYSAVEGAVTGKFLPTGNTVDIVSIPCLGNVEVSIVDAGNPGCFIKAEALNLLGTEGPLDSKILAALDTIELIRGTAAKLLGLVSDASKARNEKPSVPFLAIVNSPQSFTSYTDGSPVAANEIDFVIRPFYMQEMHKAVGGTMTVCAGAAAMIEGTLVNQVCSPRAQKEKNVVMGHASGSVSIEVEVSKDAQGFHLTKAAFGRTARRIMEGSVYVPESLYLTR